MGKPAHNQEKPQILHSASSPSAKCPLACRAVFAFAHGNLLTMQALHSLCKSWWSIGFSCAKRHWTCPGLSHVGLYLVEDRGLTAKMGAGAITGGNTGEGTSGSVRGAGTGVGMAGDGATRTGAGAGETVGRAGMRLGGGSTGDGGG